MTNYGAIPTSSHPSPPIDLEYISRAKHRIKSGLAMRRPWKTMFDFESMTLPHGFFDAVSRIKTNLAYFRANYAIGVLFILFLSLLYHPTSLIVLSILVAFWIFLYFLRDEPLVVFGHQIDDRTVMIALSVLTVVMLLLTHATWNILGSLLTAAVLVLIHAAVRRSDNLYSVIQINSQSQEQSKIRIKSNSNSPNNNSETKIESDQCSLETPKRDASSQHERNLAKRVLETPKFTNDSMIPSKSVSASF